MFNVKCLMSFLQSPEWEEFQKSVGRKTWRIYNILVIRHDLPAGFAPLENLRKFYIFFSRTKPFLWFLPEIGNSQNSLTGFNYLYCPHPTNYELGGLTNAIADIARKEGSIFLKIDFLYEAQISIDYEYVNSESVQPRKTVIIDLHQPEDKILARMHDKTRYNIRLAERRGVEVTNFQFSTQNFQKFWDLLQETSRRDKFHTHPRIYFEKLLAARSNNFSNELFFAKYQGTILAAAIVNFYRGRTSIVTYLHGASSGAYREVMAPHLLHWRIIQEARKRGCQYYDLWGIDERRWPGLTRFKLGFGGETIEHPPSVDIVYRRMWYLLYKLAKRIL